MRRVLIDGFYHGKGRGVGNYVTNLLEALLESRIDNLEIIVAIPGRQAERIIQHPNIRTVSLPQVPFPLWENVVLPIATYWYRPHIVHFPANSSALVPISGKRIVTIHDMMFAQPSSEVPRSPVWRQRLGRLYLRMNTRIMARHYRMVLTVSESSRQDILSYLSIPDERVCVTYEGPGLLFNEPQTPIETRGSLIHFASRDPRKNTLRTIEGFAQSEASRKGFTLHLIGKGFSTADIPPSIQGQVVIHDFLSTEELQCAVNDARALLYPSLYEGFGMPIVEFQRIGTPVMTSDRSACQEIAGTSALLVDPFDHIEIARAIDCLCLSIPDVWELARRARGNAQRFRWDNCARQVREIYEQA